MGRRKARESALQSLFQIHMGHVPVEEAMQHVLEEAGKDLDKEYMEKLVKGTFNQQSHIDSIIERYSVGWKLDRMPAVDLTILRLSVYEMLYEHETPPKVIINEAIELAKIFSTEESGKFVNGILGRLLGDLDELRSSVKA